MSPAEAELTVRLASTARARSAARARVGDLLRQVDSSAYTARLAERGLLALLGSRAIELAPEAADGLLRSRVEALLMEGRLRALALEMTLKRVAQALEDRGIPVLPLKGTTFADRVYGDTGLRPTTDVDVLVPRERVGAALGALAAIGYPAPEDPVWTDGLPEMHYTLRGDDAGRARVELHWRVHWADRGFSEELLRAAPMAGDGFRRAEPAHELALLVLILARDGLHGPRLAADVAAWWDRMGEGLAPGALDGIAARHPSLRRSLVAGLAYAERSLGVPARGLISGGAPDRSARLALALADPLLLDERADAFAKIMLVDALLSTGRDKAGFLRRYVLQPLPYVRATRGMEDAPAAAVAGRAALHAAGTVVKRVPRMIRALARSVRVRW